MSLKVIQDKLIFFFSQIPIKYMHTVGYLLVFLAAVIEGIPFIGNFLPGQTIVILAGFLAYQKFMNVWVLILLASVGVIIGDIISFQLGKKYGESLIKKHGKYFLLNKERYAKTKKLMKEHMGKTLFFGKFNNFTRSGASFIAGSTNMRFKKFMMWNILSGIAWGALWVLVGYFAGKSFEFIVKYVGFGALGVLIVVFLFSIIYKYLKTKQIFTKYYLHLFMIGAAAAVLFSIMLESIVELELISLDIWISNNIHLLHNDFLTSLMIGISFLGSWIFVCLVTIVGFIYLFKIKDKVSAWILVSVLAFGELIVIIMKHLVHRARPEIQLAHASGFSFPSGHATLSMVLALTLFFVLKEKSMFSSHKHTFFTCLMIYSILVGISRIYLNVHWTSDVFSGWLLGIFIVMIAILIKKYVEIIFSYKISRQN